MQDPFYVVKEEVQQSVNGAKELFARWEELLQSSNTAQDAEYQWTTKELQKIVKSIEWDLQDLEETITIVEQDKQKWKMTVEELTNRKNFVTEVKSTVSQIKTEIDNPRVSRKVQKDTREALLAMPKGATRAKSQREKLEEAIIEDNEEFLQQSQMRLEQMREEEDEQLDYLSAGVTKLNEMSLTINDELADQDKLLDEFEGQVQHTTNRVSAGIKRVSELIDRSSNTTSYMVIFGLVVVLIFLLFIVFYI